MNSPAITKEEKEVLERFESYLEMIENNQIDERHAKEILKELQLAWEQVEYPKEECVKFVFISSLFVTAANENMEILKRMFEEVKINITPKDKKRGKNGMLYRFFRQYHKESVRTNLKREFIDKVLIRHSDQLKAAPTLDTLNEKIKQLGFEPVQVILQVLLNNQELNKLAEEHYPVETLDFSIRKYLGTKRLRFRDVMESPDTIADQSDYRMLKQKNKELEKKLSKTETHASHLRKELHVFQKKEKELKGEVFQLNQEVEKTYEQALAEIEDLKKLLQTRVEEFQIEREFYIDTIASLCRDEEDLTVYDSMNINLGGKTVCVIGGNRERHYREIIERYNGKIEFVSSDDYNKISGAVSRSDVVFFLKDIIRHALFYESFRCSRQRNIPFIFVNTLGVSTFERELKKFVLTDKDK